MEETVSSALNKGFSLIEVLIAVGILASALTFIFQGFVYMTNSVQLSRDITQGCFLAEERIWEVEQREQDNNPNLPEPNGSVQLGQKDFRWNYTLDKANAPLNRINLKVSWPEKRDEDYAMDFTAYLYKEPL
jgi:prepilin-type N-terminal cleavage/methylation domain-containing protein